MGALNSIAAVVLKAAMPAPDFYQRHRIWDMALVDPDKRRHGRLRRARSAVN